MTSPYRPLYLIERYGSLSPLRRFLWLGDTPRAKHIQQQMASRAIFPDQAWGGPGLRLDVAMVISEIIRDEIDWPNANFQPADPFDKVLFNFGWDFSWSTDGCEIECILIRIEQLLQVELTSEDEAAMWRGTYGEAVDMLMAKSHDPAVCLRQFRPLPLTGPTALEAERCPKLAAFLEIREYFVKALRMDRKAVRPATRLKRVGKRALRREIDDYVAGRFGITGAVLPHRPWRRALTIGVRLSTLSFIGVFLYSVPLALMTAGIVMLIAFYVAVLRFPEAHRMAKYRVRSLGDLVKCILAERTRIIEDTQP